MSRPAAAASPVAGPSLGIGVRLGVAATLVAAAFLAALAGAAGLVWLANLAARLDLVRDDGPRLLGGLFLALAALVTLVPRWSRGASLVGCGALLFASLATISAISAVRRLGPDGPGLSAGEAMAIASAALVTLVAAGFLGLRASRSASPAAGPASVAWPIFGAFVSIALGFGLAKALPERTLAPADRAAFEEALLAEAMPRRGAAVDLDLAAWTGRPLDETGILVHLPELLAALDGEEAYLVFFNTRCGRCHDLFRERFASPIPQRIVAIEVPPPPGAALAESDQPEEIDCPTCERLSLPEGPLWMVRPPTVVRVAAGGRVTCVDETGSGSCF